MTFELISLSGIKYVYFGSGDRWHFTYGSDPAPQTCIWRNLKSILDNCGGRTSSIILVATDPHSDLQSDVKTLQDYIDAQKRLRPGSQELHDMVGEPDITRPIEILQKGNQKCRCEMVTLMREGCKCGGK